MSGDHLIIRHGRVLDVRTGEYADNCDVRIEGGSIVEIGPRLEVPDSVPVLDATGRPVLPGLIDAHVHVIAATADLAGMTTWSPSYVTAHAARIMAGMLARGFTSVRDVGGADHGLAAAVDEGLLSGPRLFFGGRALSQSGGHGDARPASVADHPHGPNTSVVADGVPDVRRAARDQLRTGAHHVKVMASGGVASPTDRVDAVQYSTDELRAVVEEARACGRYVAAHAYTAEAIAHALDAGVRSIEHGNLLDADSVTRLVDRRAFLVPTLVTYRMLHSEGAAYGLPPVSVEKVADVLDAGLAALERAAAGGVRIAFGTDLLGGMHRHQSREFAIRAEVLDPLTVLRQATIHSADLLQRSGWLGELRVGAAGDAIVVDGDPLTDVGVLAEPERNLRAVVRAGSVVHSA